MDTILITVLPFLLLALLIAFGIWMRTETSPQAARMAERFGIRKQDEMEKAIQQKALIASYYAMLCVLGAYALYKAEPHVCYSRSAVQTAFFLHLLDYMFKHFFFILCQLQPLKDNRIALCQL